MPFDLLNNEVLGTKFTTNDVYIPFYMSHILFLLNTGSIKIYNDISVSAHFFVRCWLRARACVCERALPLSEAFTGCNFYIMEFRTGVMISPFASAEWWNARDILSFISCNKKSLFAIILQVIWQFGQDIVQCYAAGSAHVYIYIFAPHIRVPYGIL